MRIIRSEGRRVLAACFLGWLMAAPAHALSVVPRSFDELVSLADLVVVGTVSAQRSAYDTLQRRDISTYITLSDLQVVKGNVTEPTYSLRVAGGKVDGYIQSYPGLPELRLGERYVLFVRGNNRDLFPVVGIGQGVYRVASDGAGREVVLRDSAADHATQLTSPVPETLQHFLERVRARLGGTAQ